MRIIGCTGRSDAGESLRVFFELGRTFIVVTAIKASVDEGCQPRAKIREAMLRYGIDAKKTAPAAV